MSWFKKGPSPHQTAVAMVGAKPGSIVVVLGAGDGGLAAELALVTGLNGQTVVVDPAAGSEATVTAAAAEAGALVDLEHALLTALPAGSGTVDVAVIQNQLGASGSARQAIVAQANRVIRPGGRVVVIEGREPRGFFASQRNQAAALDGAAVLALFEGSELRAARALAETNGLAFIEAVKPRVNGGR
jgi:ubiquinone/menaquinone biosynthesis C-methylase UbiE